MPVVGENRPSQTWKTPRAATAVYGGRLAIQALLAALCAVALVAAISRPASATAVPPTRDQTINPSGLFHSTERRSSKIAIFTKWNSMMRRYARDRRVSAVRCRTEGGSWCTVKRWHAFLRTLVDRSPAEQMRAVNRYMNRVRYISDQRNYGVIDYWATPREFFARGGDCEDFAIAKFMSLRALGWSSDRLRIAVVIDRRKRQAHAVLVAYYGGRAYILDNQSQAVLTDNRVPYYHPVYSINEHYWWFHMTALPASR